MFGSLYPCWSEGAIFWDGIQQPVQQLVALHLTLIQSFYSNAKTITENEETAAGFCYATMSRLNIATDATDSLPKLSLSMPLEALASDFERVPKAFSHP